MYGWSVNVTDRVTEARKSPAAISTADYVDWGAPDHGLMAGTRVASNLGWRDVSELSAGDKVLTFDHAMQRVVEVRRTTLWLSAPDVPAADWPVVVPEGAINNRITLSLLPDQGVMLECEETASRDGDPFAVVTAQSLTGVRGIRRVAPTRPSEMITLYFADEEVVYTEGGFLVHCPRLMLPLPYRMAPSKTVYDVLSGQKAAVVVDSVERLQRDQEPIFDDDYVIEETEKVRFA